MTNIWVLHLKNKKNVREQYSSFLYIDYIEYI